MIIIALLVTEAVTFNTLQVNLYLGIRTKFSTTFPQCPAAAKFRFHRDLNLELGTWIAGFKVQSANHYTMEQWLYVPKPPFVGEYHFLSPR